MTEPVSLIKWRGSEHPLEQPLSNPVMRILLVPSTAFAGTILAVVGYENGGDVLSTLIIVEDIDSGLCKCLHWGCVLHSCSVEGLGDRRVGRKGKGGRWLEGYAWWAIRGKDPGIVNCKKMLDVLCWVRLECLTVIKRIAGSFIFICPRTRAALWNRQSSCCKWARESKSVEHQAYEYVHADGLYSSTLSTFEKQGPRWAMDQGSRGVVHG